MKTSAIITAALFVGTTFAATSVMAQQGGISGKFNLKSSVSVYGQVKAGKKSTTHLGNFKLKNSQITGNVTGSIGSVVDGDVIVKQGATLEHGSVNLDNTRMNGNLDLNLQAKSGTVTLEKNAQAYIGSLAARDSKINGNLSLTSNVETGTITVKKKGYLNVGSLRLDNSTLNGGTFKLNAKTGNVRVDKEGKAYIGAIDLKDATITGAANLTTNVELGDVHVKKGGRLNVASAVLNGGTYGGFDHEANVVMPEGITVERDSELEIGAVEL